MDFVQQIAPRLYHLKMSFFESELYLQTKKSLSKSNQLPRIDTEIHSAPRISTDAFNHKMNMQAYRDEFTAQLSDHNTPVTAYPMSTLTPYSPIYNFAQPFPQNQMLSPLITQFNNLGSPSLPQSPKGSLLGSKNFPCHLCDKSYVRSHDLKRHQRAHHFGGTRYPCTLCNSLFSRSDALKRHLKDNKCVLKREKKEAKLYLKMMKSTGAGNYQISPPISIPDFFQQQNYETPQYLNPADSILGNGIMNFDDKDLSFGSLESFESSVDGAEIGSSSLFLGALDSFGSYGSSDFDAVFFN